MVYYLYNLISKPLGQGAIPYRRYSPRAGDSMIRCNSETDSKVWYKEDWVNTNDCETELIFLWRKLIRLFCLRFHLKVTHFGGYI